MSNNEAMWRVDPEKVDACRFSAKKEEGGQIAIAGQLDHSNTAVVQAIARVKCLATFR